MKKEHKNLVFSMIINIMVTLLKIIGGLIFNSYTLVASGYYTLCNFIQEFLAYIGSKINHRRANRKHPFGFGKVEYIAQIFVGFIFILVAGFILLKSIYLTYDVTNHKIIFTLIIILLFLYLNAQYLLEIGKKIRSQVLFVSSRSSFYDALITLISSIFIILSIWVSIFDFFGNLFIVVIIFYKGMKIIIDNVVLITGQNDTSTKITNKIKKIMNSYKEVKLSDISLINVKNFYCITIEMGIDDNINVNQLIKIENNLRYKIYKEKINIKMIDFEIIKK